MPPPVLPLTNRTPRSSPKAQVTAELPVARIALDLVSGHSREETCAPIGAGHLGGEGEALLEVGAPQGEGPVTFDLER